MNPYIRFFLGTPRRFLVTTIFVIIGMAIVHFHPGTVEQAADRLVCESMPLIKTVLACVIVFAGFRVIVGWGGRRGGGRH